jgi:hypothetical protein
MIKTLVHSAVDTIQSSKKMFVDTFVKHEGLAKSLTEFVDAQTDYTKQAFDVSYKTGADVYKTVTDKSFYTDALKAAQEAVQSVYTQKKGK